MNTINFYSVEIGDGTGILSCKNAFSLERVEILAENDKYIALRDRYFTTLAKSKDYVRDQVEKPQIHSYTNDSCWGNRVTYRLYTSRKKRADTIRREIEEFITKKYGFFARGMDLSIISEQKLKEAA